MRRSKDLCCKSALLMQADLSLTKFSVDPSGNFFSSYKNYSDDDSDIAMWPGPSFDADYDDEDAMVNDRGHNEADEDSESEESDCDVDKYEQEGRAEPKRPDRSHQAIPDNDIDLPELTTPHNQ